MKKQYPLRLFYMLLVLFAACPLIYLLTVSAAPDIPYYSLLFALIPIAFILPAIDFSRTIYWVAFRMALAAIGAGFFFTASSAHYLLKLLVAAFIFIIVTVMGYVNMEDLYALYIFCLIILPIDLIVGFIVYNVPALEEHKHLLIHSAPLSVFSVLTFFIMKNIDESRRFGESKLQISPATRRTMVTVTVLCASIIAAASLSPLIVRAFQALMRGAGAVLSITIGFLFSSEKIEDDTPVADYNFGLESSPGDRDIYEWVFTGVLAIIMILFAVYLLFGLAKLLIKLFKYLIERMTGVSGEVDLGYTEIIEKIEKKHIETVRKQKRQLKYKALQSERERIRFVYREYVMRAKNSKLTKDSPGETPNEILGEIGQRAEETGFPLPGELARLYNAARYGAEEMETGDADHLKKTLFP